MDALPGTETPPLDGPLTEDAVKSAVRGHLAARGFEVAVAWGGRGGVDLDATHADGRRYLLEAVGEAERPPELHAAFTGALGELVRRMDDPRATYGLALPRHNQYRGLVARLPVPARERLGLAVFWVARRGERLEVTEHVWG